jgi:hypothetical protein
VSLADYGKWILGVAGLTAAYFVFVATFLEFNGHRAWILRGVRFRFFRWWRHELTAAQVVLDLCLTIVLLPSSLYILFKVNLLSLASNTTASMWYYALGFTLVVGATIWRADATMRAKTRERHRLDRLAGGEEEDVRPRGPAG